MSRDQVITEPVEAVPPQPDAARGVAPQDEPRIYGLFPALVRGTDAAGKPFRVRTVLDNFSAGEFSLLFTKCVEVGAQLFVVAEIHDATVALHGTVARLEPQAEGDRRLFVSITHHRFV